MIYIIHCSRYNYW